MKAKKRYACSECVNGVVWKRTEGHYECLRCKTVFIPAGNADLGIERVSLKLLGSTRWLRNLIIPKLERMECHSDNWVWVNDQKLAYACQSFLLLWDFFRRLGRFRELNGFRELYLSDELFKLRQIFCRYKA